MALSIANDFKAACLNGGLATLNGGNLRLLNASDSELALLTLNATAFGSATVASPSVASANAITPDTSVTAGTVTKFELRTSGNAVRISGSVGVGSGDFQVSDNVIPGSATSVSCPSLSVSLQLT